MSAQLIAEKTEQRRKLIADARAITEQAAKEKRELTPEEDQRIDAIFADADKLKASIDALVKAEERKSRFVAFEEESRGRRTQPGDPGNPDGPSRDEPAGGEDRASRFAVAGRPYEFNYQRRSQRSRLVTLHPGTPEHRRHTAEYRQAFTAALCGETRGLQADLDVKGGYLVAPEQWVGELLRDVDDEVFIRRLARGFTTLAQSIGAPKRTAKASTFQWGSELSEPNTDNSLRFGKRTLTPHHMTGEVVVSNDLLRSAVMDVDAIVREEIARDSGELEEIAFMTGHGSGQPLGIFTASADGISTGRDVSDGNTATQINFDGLINAKFALKQKYRSSASWLFHRDAVKQIRKLKDGTGQYLWEESVKAGEPDRILNLPYYESEWVPHTFTTGQYVGALGDWSYYWIVDSLDMGIQVLTELYARTNQTAYLVRRKVDGAPTIEEAFVRVKLS